MKRYVKLLMQSFSEEGGLVREIILELVGMHGERDFKAGFHQSLFSVSELDRTISDLDIHDVIRRCFRTSLE